MVSLWELWGELLPAVQQLTILGDFLAAQDVKEYAATKPPGMVSKCANPNCHKQLMRLEGGRFFGFHTSRTSIEHFWLCLDCSKLYTLKHLEGKVELVKRPRRIA
jgi:hypothetical protein